MKRAALLAAVALALVGCAPVATAPLQQGDRICQWVRESVASGAMTHRMALDWYRHCGPFEVPS